MIGFVLRFVMFVLVAVAGCGEDDVVFFCLEDFECGMAGVCEPEGVCSEFDTNCPSGRRYVEEAGMLSGQCVIDSPPFDAAFDSGGGGGG